MADITTLSEFTDNGWSISDRGNSYKVVNGFVFVISNHNNHDIKNKSLVYHIARKKIEKGNYYEIVAGNLSSIQKAKEKVYQMIYEPDKAKKSFEI